MKLKHTAWGLTFKGTYYEKLTSACAHNVEAPPKLQKHGIQQAIQTLASLRKVDDHLNSTAPQSEYLHLWLERCLCKGTAMFFLIGNGPLALCQR